jgi:hypothetical protein
VAVLCEQASRAFLDLKFEYSARCRSPFSAPALPWRILRIQINLAFRTHASATHNTAHAPVATQKR